MTSISVKRKTRGRPATGTDPLVGVRFPPDFLAEIDAVAAETEKSRSDVIRALAKSGLRMYRLAKKREVRAKEREAEMKANSEKFQKTLADFLATMPAKKKSSE